MNCTSCMQIMEEEIYVNKTIIGTRQKTWEN